MTGLTPTEQLERDYIFVMLDDALAKYIASHEAKHTIMDVVELIYDGYKAEARERLLGIIDTY